MNPEAQRIAIAEACGWTGPFGKEWLREYGPEGEDLWAFCGTNPEGDRTPLQDCCNDLNAMHEAEGLVIEPHYIEEFSTELYMVVERFWTADRWVKFTRGGINYALAHATAAQRAEAFLRTIGRWVEDEAATGKEQTLKCPGCGRIVKKFQAFIETGKEPVGYCCYACAFPGSKTRPCCECQDATGKEREK